MSTVDVVCTCCELIDDAAKPQVTRELYALAGAPVLATGVHTLLSLACCSLAKRLSRHCFD